ncbi:RNA-directed DNA polymerase, eukaryota, reverse transcriptase zinc-binding domain protein, partial [Tanacetum coccineum]
RNESMNTEEYEGDIGLNYNEEANSGGNGSNSRDNDIVERSNVKSVERSEDMNDLLNEGDVRKSTVSEINDDFINDADRNTDNDRGNKNENVKSGDCIGNDSEKNENINQSSYAKTLTKNMSNDGNQLFTVPTGTNSKGEEVVVFDEELVRGGSEKWKLTVCGYFVGCKMQVYELEYNVRRMWGRFGLKDIVVDAEGMCFFKFKEEEGMKYVINHSPWLVNGKPLIVQKWDPEVVIVKESPCKIPIWIRLYNVPLEAWSIKGLSAISSRLGRPLMMDQMTSDMCKEGSGRLGYARVLVEIDASKSYLDKIEINYVDDEKEELKVTNSNYCKSKPVVNGDNGKKTKDNMNHLDSSKEGFMEVKNIKKNRFEANCSKYTGVNEYTQGNSKGWDQHQVKSIKKTCNWVFGNWNWVSNVDHSPACCRIVIGWNSLLMDVMIVHSCRQAILCLIESALMGDFNVILKPEEQSNGPSSLNNDMVEFRDNVNSLEIDDLCSSRFNFK